VNKAIGRRRRVMQQAVEQWGAFFGAGSSITLPFAIVLERLSVAGVNMIRANVSDSVTLQIERLEGEECQS